MTRIHQVQGRDLVDALERARETVGDQAVVLSRRKAPSGITLAVADSAPRTRDELTRLRGRARAILAHAPQTVPPPRPRTTEVERRLQAAGASKALVERVTEAVAGRTAEGGHPLDLAGEELAAIFPVANLHAPRGTVSVLAFLGSPGCGKTTTAAKLALRLKQAGKRVALVTTDTHRVGAVEQAKALGRHIGCTAIALGDPARLAQALATSSPRPDVVLVDTTGRVEEDESELDRLEAALAVEEYPARLTRYAVLPASASEEALGRTVEAGRFDGCVITRLDETEHPARVLETALHGGLPIAFLCDGPRIEAHLHRASGAGLADIFLRGRVA